MCSSYNFLSGINFRVSSQEVTKKDLHQQTLARLDWELEQRTRYETDIQKGSCISGIIQNVNLLSVCDGSVSLNVVMFTHSFYSR